MNEDHSIGEEIRGAACARTAGQSGTRPPLPIRKIASAVHA